MHDPAAQFSDTIPRHYDTGLGPRLFADYAADLASRVAALAPNAVLELAAGTGIVTRELRNALAASADLVASDLNEPMLVVARTKFADHDLVRFEVADAMELQFADAVFDAVTCQFGVMFFPDKLQSYREAHRVLRPGGSYVFSVWDSWANNAFAAMADGVAAEFFANDPPSFYKVPFSYHDTEAIRRSLRGAGFADVQVDTVSKQVPIGDSMEFATGLVHGNPLYKEIVVRGGDPDDVTAAMATAIERDLGTELDLRAFVIHARRP
jgi:ubiquinone/menaquinone biosynthesis C-methylase UbiE